MKELTREEKNTRQREYRAANGNLATKRYEKTKRGFLVRLYRNMESRVTGVQSKKKHLYEGKDLLSRDEFYEWANNSFWFHTLFHEWEEGGYQRRMTPSVDRVDSTNGYSVENMEWVPFHENCRRGAKSKNLRAQMLKMHTFPDQQAANDERAA